MRRSLRANWFLGSIFAGLILIALDRPIGAQEVTELATKTYGLLEFKNSSTGVGPEKQIRYIGILWQRLLERPGPVKEKVDAITGASSPTGIQCGSLDSPRPNNTVLLEMSGNRDFFRGRYRAFLRWNDCGSLHDSGPALAVDFEVEEGGEDRPGHIEPDLMTIRISGMDDLSNDRLPWIQGMPPDIGCISGCG
jgi:hypothetical protein